MDDEEKKLREAQDYAEWTSDEFAHYVLQHCPTRQSEEKVKFLCELFKKNDLTGKKIKDLSKDNWDDIVFSFSYKLELPPVELLRGDIHPVVETIRDIPNKLRDCQGGIWFTALRYFKRTQQFDAVYKDEEGIWCHDRNGRPYFNPGSWRRYGFYPQKEGETAEEIENIMKTWHVAYHGTKFINVNSIVRFGLVPPGTEIEGKVIKNERGKAGTVGNKIPVYVSPSINYASHYCYTQPQKENDTYVYCVFQVRIRPGSFRVQGNTLWAGGWGDKSILFDERFGPDELEWLVEDAIDVRVTGLMVHKDTKDPQQAVKDLFEKHKTMCSTKRGEGNGKWFWNCAPKDGKTLDRKGPWKPYSKDESAKLEKAFLNWQSVCYLGQVETDLGINPYFVDFKKMEQIRCNDHKLRRVIKRETS